MCLISDVGILKFLKKICCSFESNKTQKVNLYNCVQIIYNLQQKIIFWGWGKWLFFLLWFFKSWECIVVI
jgi:hypothetical protein